MAGKAAHCVLRNVRFSRISAAEMGEEPVYLQTGFGLLFGAE